jgi:hypothetical protein
LENQTIITISTIMTTKPSSAPWADEPFALIATPSNRMDVRSITYLSIWWY